MEPIASIDINDRDAFLSQYYDPEQPVVLRGIETGTTAVEALARQLRARLASSDRVRDRMLWHDVQPPVVEGLCPTPALVGRLLQEDHVISRDTRVRVWMSLRGHRTPWHYDGNSLLGFNLQLKGKKHWRIVSPATPFPCLPFSNVCAVDDRRLAGKQGYEFDLNEGEMLFLPRYWFHSVESVGEFNINVNWVLMTSREPVDSDTARRESEIQWLKGRWSAIFGKRDGRAPKPVTSWSGTARALEEIMNLPRVLAGSRELLRAFHSTLQGRRRVLSRASTRSSPSS